jgi:signal transduction histidine kinase
MPDQSRIATREVIDRGRMGAGHVAGYAEAVISQVTALWRTKRADPRLIDAAVVTLCLVLAAFAVKAPWSSLPRPVIAVSGLVAGLAAAFRYRLPVAVTLIGAGAYALSGNPVPLIVGLFAGSVAGPRRSFPALAVIGLAGFIAPEWVEHGSVDANAVLSAVAGTIAVMGAGRYTATRRELMSSLEERAERAETEHRLRAEQARVGERTRIAREMHDVLAHKVALISLHAGGLEVNADAEPSRIEQGAALIRATAQEALEELRSILGLLRTGEVEPDDTSFADLGGLVASWQEAGATVAVRDDVGTMPAATARAAYRLAQEGLTNAHKHAPGAAVAIAVTGGHGSDVTVTVTNGPPRQSAPELHGSGSGLIGLGERLRLIGGTLNSGPDDAGGWRLEGRLPWLADQYPGVQ